MCEHIKIALIGFMGSGKTTITKKLSNYFNIPYKSLDKEIELYTKKKIKDIFNEIGEEAFRNLESEILANIIKNVMEQSSILDLGGGSFINNINRKLIKNDKNIITIFLNVPFSSLCNRLFFYKYDRPLLQTENWRKEALKIFNHRHSIYKQALYTLNIKYKDKVKTTLNDIIELLKTIPECKILFNNLE